MMYESDSRLIARDAYDVLEIFPDIGYVFDLDHFNNGIGNKVLGCDMGEFIRNVENRVEYIHASNNRGTLDEHNAISDGTLDWCHVLDLLDLSQVVKIIIEVRDIGMVERSFKDLEDYMISRFFNLDSQVRVIEHKIL